MGERPRRLEIGTEEVMAWLKLSFETLAVRQWTLPGKETRVNLLLYLVTA